MLMIFEDFHSKTYIGHVDWFCFQHQKNGFCVSSGGGDVGYQAWFEKIEMSDLWFVDSIFSERIPIDLQMDGLDDKHRHCRIF